MKPLNAALHAVRLQARKRNDFFVRHLLGVEPPPWN